MEQLIVCKTEDGRFAVRPVSWAGIWGKNGLLTNECNSLAYFEDEQDANDFVAYRTLGPVEELSVLVKARDEGRVLPDGSGWFVTSNGKKLTVIMDINAVREAEAAIGGGGDGCTDAH